MKKAKNVLGMLLGSVMAAALAMPSFAPALAVNAASADASSLQAAGESADTGKAAETLVVDGKTYKKLYTIVCADGLTTTDPQFDQYFQEGSAEAGVRAIAKAGNVYVNGQQIPYALADGTPSKAEMRVSDGVGIWQVDGGWAWSDHRQRNWDEQFFMPKLEPGYDDGTPVDLETADYLFTKYLAFVVGQTVDLYAEEGSQYASLITSTFYNSTLVTSVNEKDGLVTFTVLTDQGDVDLGIEFPEANVQDDIQPEDMIIYWQDGTKGWMARRAYKQVGRLIQNTDPTNPKADHEPYFQPEGSDTLITTGDSYIGKNFAEAFRHTQFIRGERRLGQYDYADEKIIMWSSDEGADHVIGFTRGDRAPEALTYAIHYATTVADSTIHVSLDGSDVPADEYWVTPQTWLNYQEVMEQAQQLIVSGDETNLECDSMLLELANVFGGGEDLTSDSPLKMNPLGMIGSIAYGTKAE